MYMLDPGIAACQALVIDPNPTSRSILVAQLKDLGVGMVVQCGTIADGRRHMELRGFDLVLCEMDFPGKDARGDELLDDLRRGGHLSLSSIFIMVTGEASYSRVAEAAESALDSYLLKPFAASKLADRILQARHRKKTLQAIYDAIELDQHELATRLCKARFVARGAYWLYAARIGAELLLRMEDHDGAREMFEAILAEQALPWARLGVARVQSDKGETQHARRTLESLLIDEPNFVDAYDVMGRSQVETGNLKEAQETYRKAAELTPGSLGRAQKYGMLAFMAGDMVEASKALQRAAALGTKSKMFDYQSLVLLAFTSFAQKDTKGIQRCTADLGVAYEKAPNSSRMRRFVDVTNVAYLMATRKVAQVIQELRTLAKEIDDDNFDVEAACNMLMLMALIAAAELDLDEAGTWAESIAARFSGARGVTELLAQSAQAHPPTAEIVRLAHVKVNEKNQAALQMSLAGDPEGAVRTLLTHTQLSRNLRYLDTARGLLNRYRDRIPDAVNLLARADSLKTRHGAASTVPRLGAETLRQPGGLSIRGKDAQTPAEAAPT